MTSFAAIPTLTEFARTAVGSGYLISLSLVCLLQYLLYLYRVSRIRQEHARVTAKLQNLENQFVETRRDCSVATVENAVLRDFVAAPPPEKLVMALLEQLVPDAASGWSAYISLHPEPHIFQHRGLQEHPPEFVDIDDENLRPVWNGGHVVLRDPRVAKSRFLLNFGSVDRNRSGQQLYVFGVRHEDRSFGLLVTSKLFPADVPVEQQIELVQRLCASLARHLQSLEQHALAEEEMRVSADRLALRSMFDHQFETSQQLTQQFVRSMQTRLSAECAVLFYARSEDGTEAPPVFSGTAPSLELRELWQRSRFQLEKRSTDRPDCMLIDEYALMGMGLHETIRSAILMPVSLRLKTIGTLCLTRCEGVPFSLTHQSLVQWAVDLYVEKLSLLMEHTEVSRLARVDTVTQIANRHVFDSELERELKIAYATSSELSVILFDVDKFKSVNDSLGHPAGDQVLRAFGGILRNCLSHLRAGDRALCARYGGDEFALILPGMGPLGAARIGELIRQHLLQSKIQWQDSKLNITISGGFATYPENGLTAAELIASADTALFKAKAGGRNAICWPALSLVQQVLSDSSDVSSILPAVTTALGTDESGPSEKVS